ncbi:MAG: RICIN domain-containing protein [Pirellulales bacterium]|nr:RICIN domain-containing protein [Pirellulales bacterium]
MMKLNDYSEDFVVPKSQGHRHVIAWLIGMSLIVLASPTQAQFDHPCIPTSLWELDNIKANLDMQPWKTGYAGLAGASTSQLTWPPEGPWETVSRTPDVNLTYWKDDMNALYNLARMWYFTGNEAYAQKARDIIIAWATTQESFSGHETPLSLGDYAVAYAGGADILRGTWPGWTAADTATVKSYFENVTWPTTLAGYNTIGPANKGMLTLEAGIAVAAFLDDTEKFNHCIDLYRTSPASGLFNTLPTGEMGETGRDQGHAYVTMLGMAVVSEIAWKQGIDLYSELDNRLLAVGEYYARNSLALDNPFVPFGTIDFTYYANNSYYFIPDNAAFLIIQNAYKNRKGLPTPWIDRKLESLGGGGNLMYAKTTDFSTATPQPAVVRPPVSLASSGLTLTTLGSQTAGRSVSYANGVWTMTGLGGGVWTGTGGADDCQFAYQAMTGDCAMVVRITSATASGSNNGKVGLMIRDDLSATVSRRAWVGIVPNASPNLIESRQDGWTDNWGGDNWAHRSNALPTGWGLPYWLKIERRDDMIATYTSQDGTSWSPIINSYYANLSATVYIGMFLCSGTVTADTATFDHVAFTGGSGGLVTTPAAPATLFAAGSDKAITVRWLPSFGATAYDLLRSTTSGSGYTVIASDLTADKTSYVDTTASPGTTYYYVARAKNSAGASTNSPEFDAALLPARMANLATTGTANDDQSNPDNAGNAFDQDAGSLWFHGGGTTGWLEYDFGAGNAQVVKRYTVNSANLIPERDPKDWQFQGSSDGANWDTLDTQIDQAFPNRMQRNTYDISNTNAYRYYRFNVTANNGHPDILHIGDIGLWNYVGRTIPDGRYVVASRNSNKIMDVTNSADGAPVVQQTFEGDDTQQWDIEWQGNGQYSATDVASAKVLDNGGTSSTGENLVIQSWSGGSSQLWTIEPDSDGFFRITSANSGLVADVSGGSTADGANIIQSTYTGGDSQLWMPGFAVQPQPAPPAPTGVTATPVSIYQIDLSWTASPGAVSYNIKRATVSGGPYATVVVGANTTNYTDSGLLSSTPYYYVISAVNGSGESADSAQAQATTLTGPPAAPTGMTAILGTDQVALSWAATDGATSYSIKRATTSGGPYTTVANSLSGTTYTDTGINHDIAYYYVVVATNADGTGPDSAEAVVGPGTLGVHLKFDETGGDIAVDSSGYAHDATLVNDASFALGILDNALNLAATSLQRATLPEGIASGLTDFTISTWIRVESFATWQRIFDFGAGTDNYMFLAAQGPAGAGRLRFSIRTPSFVEQNIDSTVALTTGVWTYVAVTRSGSAVSLYVDGSLAGSGTITINPSDLGFTTQNYLGKSQFPDPYLDGALDDFRIYCQALSATEIDALAHPPAGAPRQLVATPGNGKATLTWLPNLTTTYTVKRSTTSGGPYDIIADGLTDTTYTDIGLTNDVTFYYVVSGANDNGPGPDSAEVSVTPSSDPIPISLPNGDFEQSTQENYPTGFDSPYDVPGWTDITITDSGIENDAWWITYDNYSAFMKAGDGAYIMSQYTIQSGDEFEIGFVGKSWDGASEWTATLFYDNPANVIGTYVQSVDGTWTQYTDAAAIPATAGSVGGTLGVSFVNTGAGFANLDNVTLTVTSPGSPDTTAPTAPTGLAATAGNGYVDLDWADNTEPDLASYTVYRSTTSGSGYASITSGLATSAYADNSITNSATYYYVVTARDETGNESTYSNEASVNPDATTGAVTWTFY